MLRRRYVLMSLQSYDYVQLLLLLLVPSCYPRCRRLWDQKHVMVDESATFSNAVNKKTRHKKEKRQVINN